MKRSLFIFVALLGGTTVAQASWGGSGTAWGGHYYTNDAVIDAVTTAESTSSDSTSRIQAGDVATSTITNLTVDVNDTLIVAYNDGNRKNLDLTADTLNLGAGSTIQVNASQKLTVTSLNMGDNARLVVDEGATAVINEATSTTLTNIEVNGTLDVSSKVKLHQASFTFGTSGKLGGTLNFGTDNNAALTINLNAKDAIVGGGYEQTLFQGGIWNLEHVGTATISLVDSSDYKNGGLIYQKDGKYYSSVSYNGGWSLSNEMSGLEDGKVYLVAGFDNSGPNTLSAVLVPEPATATLSLLALAGLAVRRRRK